MEQIGPRFGYWGNYAMGFLILFFASLFSFWLLVDPEWGIFGWSWAWPWEAWMLWMMMAACWVGFQMGVYPFSKLKQPWCGITATAAIVAIGTFMVWFICGAWGHFDPTFAFGTWGVSGGGGTGQLACGLWVLIGFVTFNHWSANWAFYPWMDRGLKQPLLGVATILWGAFVTVLFYMFIIYPNLAPWVTATPLMSLPVAIGWWYAILESFLFIAIVWGNWPFTMFKTRGGAALASLVGIFAFGTGGYFVIKWALETFMLSASVKAAIGPMLPAYVAQFLVWMSFWAILWGLINPGKPFPYKFSPWLNRVLQLAIIMALTVVSFYGYYYWFAGAVLHEPAIGGGFSGDALGFADWLILMELFFFPCWSFVYLKKIKAPA